MASTKALVAKDQVCIVRSFVVFDITHFGTNIQGNAAFKAGDYPTAIGHYTTAILADRTDATYPLNRAAAYLKLGKYVQMAKLPMRLPSQPSSVETKMRKGTALLF